LLNRVDIEQLNDIKRCGNWDEWACGKTLMIIGYRDIKIEDYEQSWWGFKLKDKVRVHQKKPKEFGVMNKWGWCHDDDGWGWCHDDDDRALWKDKILG